MAFWKNTASYVGATGKQALQGGWTGYKLGFGVVAAGGTVAAIGAAVIGGAAIAVPLLTAFAVTSLATMVPAVLGGPVTRNVVKSMALVGLLLAGGAVLAGGLAVAGSVWAGIGLASATTLGGSALGFGGAKLGGGIGLLDGLLFKGPRAIGEGKEQDISQDLAQAQYELQQSRKDREMAEAYEAASTQQAPHYGQRAPQNTDVQMNGAGSGTEVTNSLFPDAAHDNPEYHREKYNVPKPRETLLDAGQGATVGAGVGGV